MSENLSEYVRKGGYFHRLTGEERACLDRVAALFDDWGFFEVDEDEGRVRVSGPAHEGNPHRFSLELARAEPPRLEVFVAKGREEGDEEYAAERLVGLAGDAREILAEHPAVDVLHEEAAEGGVLFRPERTALADVPDLIEKLLSRFFRAYGGGPHRMCDPGCYWCFGRAKLFWDRAARLADEALRDPGASPAAREAAREVKAMEGPYWSWANGVDPEDPEYLTDPSADRLGPSHEEIVQVYQIDMGGSDV